MPFFQLRGLVGEDRHVGDFRTGTGRGGDGNHGRAFARHLVDAEHILQLAVVPGIDAHALGDVDGTAAAQADQAIVTAVAVGLHAVLDNGDFRVRHDPVENLVVASAQVLQGQLHGTGLDQRRVGHDQRIVDIQSRQLGGQLLDGSGTRDQFMGDLE